MFLQSGAEFLQDVSNLCFIGMAGTRAEVTNAVFQFTWGHRFSTYGVRRSVGIQKGGNKLMGGCPQQLNALAET